MAVQKQSLASLTGKSVPVNIRSTTGLTIHCDGKRDFLSRVGANSVFLFPDRHIIAAVGLDFDKLGNGADYE